MHHKRVPYIGDDDKEIGKKPVEVKDFTKSLPKNVEFQGIINESSTYIEHFKDKEKKPVTLKVLSHNVHRRNKSYFSSFPKSPSITVSKSRAWSMMPKNREESDKLIEIITK